MYERAARGPAERLPTTPLVEPIEPAPSRWAMPAGGPVDDGDIVAIGADLEPGTLLAAYRSGLFPMPFDRRRIAWFSPDPRGVLPLDGLRVTRSLRRSVHRYSVSMDTEFRTVIEACADPTRSGGWIDDAFVDAYCHLHRLGWAHSIEVWAHEHPDDEPPDDEPPDDEPRRDEPRRDDVLVSASGHRLVGGLYGVRIGGFFAGESMFHRATDASKVALVHLLDWLNTSGGRLLDVQWTTPHLVSLGAVDIDRDDYLRRLAAALTA